ncbi:MAG: amidohydrolase family protein [Actinomycetota bacterium]
MAPLPAPIAAELDRLRPAGAEVVDAHTHLGVDEDGSSLTPDELLAGLDAAGIARAWVFPLHDPQRAPAYRVPNDRVLQWAAASGGRLVPFCRLDPADGPLPELERCLARGARGVKLHPRAQSFAFSEGLADGIFAAAEEAGVPVLIHAGRGMPPIAEGLARAALRHPRLVLVLAHAGIADQALLVDLLRDHPGVLYDTSAFNVVDLRSLLARVPPQRVVFGSDPPYGDPAAGLYVTLRALAACGVDGDATRAVLGATARAAERGGPLPQPTAPAAAEAVALPADCLRVWGYALVSLGALLTGNPLGALEGVELALAACRDPAADGPGHDLAVLADLLAAAATALSDPEGRREALHLLFLAAGHAATVPAPA